MKATTTLIIAILLTSSITQAKDLSAMEAVKLASKEVNKIARDSLVQVVGSENSPGILPNEWAVLFYDPYAQQHGTLVRVAGSTIVEIRDGYTQLDKFRLAAYKQEEILSLDKIKIDSPQVLNILQKSSDLSSIKLSSLRLWLKKQGKGPLAPAVWHVTLYALKASDGKETSFGTAEISATSGQVLKLKIKPEKLTSSK